MPVHAPEPTVVEADTAEAALEDVRHLLGDDAEILEARKVLRGGWRGFFAVERVELVARPRTAPAVTSAPPVAAPDLVAARAQLDTEAERDRADFDRMLRRLLEKEREPSPVGSSTTAAVPPSAETPPAPVLEPPPPAPVPPPPTPASMPSADAPPEPAPVRHRRPTPVPGTVRWSVDALRDLRLPPSLVAACQGLDPADDAAWVAALADAVASWYRPLPVGESALVGPRVKRVARTLQVPVVAPDENPVPAGDVALETTDGLDGRAWAVRAAGDRWLHVVAGGRRWELFVFDDALAVSWAHPTQLPTVLAVADRLGLVLGYGMVEGRIVRATPVDVAVAVRSLVSRACATGG